MDTTVRPDITALFIRHPSYRRLQHPEQGFTLVSSKTVGIANQAYREMTELLWLFAENEAIHGITDHRQLRSFDAIYSTPSIRGVQGCLALSPGLRIRQKPTLPQAKDRYQQKLKLYSSLAWTPEDISLVPSIIEEEIEQEKIAYAADITILDELFELLDIPPKWTGANEAIFREAMNRSSFDQQRVSRLQKKLRHILLKPSSKPKRIIFMVHGSTMVLLRKYGKYILSGTWSEAELLNKTYRDIKYDNIPIDDLSYHGSGLVFRFNKEGACLNQHHLSSKEVIEKTTYDPAKRLIFRKGFPKQCQPWDREVMQPDSRQSLHERRR